MELLQQMQQDPNFIDYYNNFINILHSIPPVDINKEIAEKVFGKNNKITYKKRIL